MFYAPSEPTMLLSVTDYVIQVSLLLLTVVYPFLLDLRDCIKSPQEDEWNQEPYEPPPPAAHFPAFLSS
jgi:hypothetical protein